MAAITQAQVQRWRLDPAAFAEEVLWTPTPDSRQPSPMRLHPQSRDFLRECGRRGPEGHLVYHTIVASRAKREGKTKEAAALGCWHGLTRERCNIGVLANSERQAMSNVFSYIADFFRDSPTLKGLVAQEDLQSRVLRIRGLGNKIECYPANWRTIQGTAFQVLLADELHAAEDRGRAYMFASAQTEGRDAQVIVASQAGENVDANPMWRYYLAAGGGLIEGGYRTGLLSEGAVLFEYRQEPVTPWARRLADQARATLLPSEYARLFRNEWGALGAKLFTAEDVEAAAREFEPPQTRAAWQELQQQLGIAGLPMVHGVGLDRAGVSREGDRTVWTDVFIVEVRGSGFGVRGSTPNAERGTPNGPLIVVPDCETLPTGHEVEVLDRARRSREVYGEPDIVTMEYYGCSDLLGKLPRSKTEQPNPQAQQRIFNRLFRALREGRMIFPAGAGVSPTDGTTGLLKAELIGMEYEMGATLPKFGTQAGHDDHAYSLAWAADAAAEASGEIPFVQELGRGEAGEEEPPGVRLQRAIEEERARWLFGAEDED